ncbi:c-type cytochrome [Teredinibacter purpureus]|uniref:c-type cytochrome n=1 Tax=Teredinibacter purpureus TaxID=2731756 RepID=UPI0005F786C8|nr:c-type cytochrome [Teredinibacter purpureus]
MNKAFRSTMISLSLLAVAAAAQVNAAGDAVKGETLASACVACHGEGGNSTVPSFPKLAGLGEKYLLKQLVDIQSGERAVPQMAGQLDASSQQNLADMAAYFAKQTIQLSGSKEQKVQLNTGVKVDGLALGEKVYRGGNMESNVPACSGCHSPTGQGNAPAGFPRLGGQHAGYIAQQLRNFRAGDRTNDTDAMIMRGVAQYMSDAEIDAVANYIAGLH